VNRCEVNLIDGTFTCAQTAPSTFDLTWVRNGIGSLFQKTTTIQTLGPVKTRIKGQFASQMANVNGMWDGHSALDQPGNVVDTEQTTVIREIRIEANP
jgi:hypothetical protein